VQAALVLLRPSFEQRPIVQFLQRIAAAAIAVSVAVCESTFPGVLHTQEFLFCHFVALLEQTAWHELMASMPVHSSITASMDGYRAMTKD
jgi:hypothetical protein